MMLYQPDCDGFLIFSQPVFVDTQQKSYYKKYTFHKVVNETLDSLLMMTSLNFDDYDVGDDKDFLNR